MMKNTGMLILTNPSKFVRYMPRLQKEIRKVLYVQILTQNPLKLTLPSRIERYPAPFYSSSVKSLYTKSITSQSLDVRILLSSLKTNGPEKIVTRSPIEVVFFDQHLKKDDMDKFVCNCVENRTADCSVVSLEDVNDESEPEKFECDDKSVYDYVVLGGTFDRLHCGHKALLSDAILRCQKHLTIGVTGTEMLKSKKLWELIQPCEERIKKVADFVCDIDRTVNYSIVQINDVYGPTKDDPTFEALIVSVETLRGGSLINQMRQDNGLKPLMVHSVGLLPDQRRDDVEEDKVSSSNDRLRLLGTRLREPKERPDLQKWPYMIGLTGGICSGKTAISGDLEELGATIVNCDRIAHQEALEALNQLVWPAVIERVNLEAEKVRKAGGKVLVVEAALLLQAGWAPNFHEIWASIVPPDEAIRRLLEERGAASREDAAARLASQPSNSDYVSAASIVFSSAWSREFTKRQVHRAWSTLQEFLADR